MQKVDFDLVINGGEPAGLAAGLYAAVSAEHYIENVTA